VTVRQKLTETETILAFVVGGGLTLLILGFMLAAGQAGSSGFDVSRLNILMIVGGFLVVAGVISWIVMVRPWKNFDDWSTPLYTGHDAHHATPAATHGQAIAEAKGAEQSDNLTTIAGITPKVLNVLNNVGIYTYAQLAARRPEDIERIVRDSGLRVTGSVANWITEAKAASTGSTASH
jgi:predicted flap endonuclease-1-like 5' DNA nuclease